MCSGTHFDTCLDIILDMCLVCSRDMCSDMYLDVCLDMCLDMCLGVSVLPVLYAYPHATENSCPDAVPVTAVVTEMLRQQLWPIYLLACTVMA